MLLRCCSNARTPVTIIFGGSFLIRHKTSSRLPIVSTFGLTRSNGKVSHAGKRTTSRSGRNATRSSRSCPAINPVGAATITNSFSVRCVKPESNNGQVCSAQTIEALFSPSAALSAGSKLKVEASAPKTVIAWRPSGH